MAPRGLLRSSDFNGSSLFVFQRRKPSLDKGDLWNAKRVVATKREKSVEVSCRKSPRYDIACLFISRSSKSFRRKQATIDIADDEYTDPVLFLEFAQ